MSDRHQNLGKVYYPHGWRKIGAEALSFLLDCKNYSNSSGVKKKMMPNNTIQKFRRVLAFLALCGTAFFIFPFNLPNQIQTKVSAETKTQDISPKVSFEENRGQFDKQVRYFARAGGANVFLTASEAVYVLPLKNNEKHAFALRMKIVGANTESLFAGENLREHRTNYFKGAEENWRTDIPNFGTVRYENVYDKIDMVWHGLESGATRYDFVVRPNADAEQIALDFEGADNLEIDAEGNLLIHTAAGIIKQNKPFSFQETDGAKQEIESRFIIEQSKIKFAVGEYDRSKPLVIDPTVSLNNLAFATFLGGSEDDQAFDLKIDNAGSIYVTGFTESPFFPTTSGTFDTNHNANQDVFVTKLNPAGTQVIYSTFIGGNGSDEGRSISIDSSGNAYLTGVTTSPTFPTTAGVFDTTHNGGADVFALKLNPNGSALVYSTYVGGNAFDESYSIARDSSNNVYVIGRTAGGVTPFPTTAGAFDTTFNGVNDAFVFKLDGTGASLLYSTFLGGDAIDYGQGIAVDAGGNVFATGFTASSVTPFPTTAGAFDTTFSGNVDIFVTKLNSAGSALTYSTLMGGTNEDSAQDIEIDAQGNAYIVGNVLNGGFPTTAGAFDTTHNGVVDAVVVKLNPAGSALVYSTYLGGISTENGNDIALDQFGNAYVTGLTFDGVTDYPTTTGAFDTAHNGGQDVFVSKLNGNGSTLLYSTLLGGAENDSGNGIAVDQNGNIYVTGLTNDAATDLPVTGEAFQSFHGGLTDVFVSKFGDYSISGRVIDATTGLPVSNVMVALSGQTSDFMLTGADGRFGFTNTTSFQPAAVSASRSGYSINPAVFNITSLTNNRDLVFLATVGSPTGGSGGTLRFENLSYNKAENGSTVTVTVKRIGTITEPNPVTVDWATVSETAVEGQDFAATSGVLTFNILETTKTITVPLFNDAILEPRESFSISLNNPTNNAEIENGRGSANVQILDEDLANGSLLISEFRQRGRLGANDEYIKLFNPNDFDVTIQTSDGSNGLTVARSNGANLTSIAAIPNLVTIRSRGHYLLTNNNPNGGFSLIDYPTGNGTTTAVGDRTFSADIPDNSNLVLLKTADSAQFNQTNLLDAVGFGAADWKEGNGLSPIGAENSESSFVRKLTADGLQDTNNNQLDFLLVDNHATIFALNGQKNYSALGVPAPETSDSLRQMKNSEVSIEDYGAEVFNSTPVPNGSQGTLTVYRRITNNTNQPISALRLRAIDFPTVGTLTQRRFSSRPDFRLLNSTDEGEIIKGVTLAAERLQPNGGGINSTLTVESVTANTPLFPNQSVIVAIRFGVMRYGRHPILFGIEALQ